MIVTVMILHGLARREDWKAATEEGPETDKSKNSGLEVLAEVRQSPYLSMMVALLLSESWSRPSSTTNSRWLLSRHSTQKIA
jgi:hypothetical protein